MRAYEFRRYLLGKDINEADIRNHIENVRRIEKALDKTAESLPSVESVDSQLTWRVLPWKRTELLESLGLYFAFNKTYTKPSFHKIKATFKECPECGAKTPLGSTYCKNCGAAIGKTQFSQINEMYDSVEDKWSKHRGLVIGGIAAIAALILAGVIYSITAFPIPDVVGQSPAVASRMLVEQGINEGSINIQCYGSELSAEDVANGEYEVVGQSPNAGRKIHKSTDVLLDCKDLFRERSEAVSGCRYYEASEAEDIAEKYKYVYKEKVLDKNLPADEKLYVVNITDQDDAKRTVTFELNSEKNIEAWISDEVKKLIGKPAEEAEKLEELTGCGVSCINTKQEEVFFFDDDIGDYQITGFNGFDIEAKDISIAVDTKEHLEEQEYIASLKNKIPFEGMSEDYIDDTGAGKHTTEQDIESSEEVQTEYVWKSNDGKYDVLTVICTDSIVTEVYKDNEEVFWKGNLPDCSVDGDAEFAKLEEIEAEKEAKRKAKEEEKRKKLEAEAEEYAAAARDAMSVEVTRSTGTYHVDGCRYISGVNTYSATYGSVKYGHHACEHCNPDTYCERAYREYKEEYILKEGDL